MFRHVQAGGGGVGSAVKGLKMNYSSYHTHIILNFTKQFKYSKLSVKPTL